MKKVKPVVKTVLKQKDDSIHHEMALMRSFMIGIAGCDEEGSYRPEFVERTLKAAQEKAMHQFTSPSDFLKTIRS